MSVRSTLLACGVSATIGCAGSGARPHAQLQPVPVPAPAAPAAPAATPAPAAAGSFVLVHAAADLYIAPEADAPRLNPYAFPDRGRAQKSARVFRLLGEQAGWLALQTLPEPPWERHCHPALSETEGLALQLWARAEDRVWVSSREVRLAYRDGTAITLSAGIALWPKDRPGFYQVNDNGLSFSVNPPRDAVGTSYDPSAKFPAPTDGKRYIPQKSVETLRYGETANVVVESRFLPTLLVTEEKAVPGGTLVTLPLGCAKLEVLARAGTVQESGGLLGLLGSGTGPAGPSPRVGATLYWTNGTPAGKATGSFSFEKEIEPREGRRCFERALRYIDPKTPAASVDPRNILRLCLATDDVVASQPGAKLP